VVEVEEVRKGRGILRKSGVGVREAGSGIHLLTTSRRWGLHRRARRWDLRWGRILHHHQVRSGSSQIIFPSNKSIIRGSILDRVSLMLLGREVRVLVLVTEVLLVIGG